MYWFLSLQNCPQYTASGRKKKLFCYVKPGVLVNDGGNLGDACAFAKAPGLQMVKDVNLGFDATFRHSLDNWVLNPNTAFFQGSITTDNMPPEVINAAGNVQTKLLEYMTNNAVDFIKGKKDIHSGSDWATWCKTLKKYGYEKVNTLYQP